MGKLLISEVVQCSLESPVVWPNNNATHLWHVARSCKHEKQRSDGFWHEAKWYLVSGFTDRRLGYVAVSIVVCWANVLQRIQNTSVSCNIVKVALLEMTRCLCRPSIRYQRAMQCPRLKLMSSELTIRTTLVLLIWLKAYGRRPIQDVRKILPPVWFR